MEVNTGGQRKAAYNSTYPKGGVSCSKDSLVVNQTLVFQIKFCGKSPALRVAAKRCPQYEKTACININFNFKLLFFLQKGWD